MRAVNLLPREDPRRRGRRMTLGLQLALVSPFLLGSLLVAGYLLTSSKVNDKRATLKALQEELAAIPPRAKPWAGNAQLILQRDQRIVALGAALQSRIAWDRILREISSVLPEDVWLTTLSAQSPQSPAAAPVAPAPVATGTSGGTTTSTPAPPRVVTSSTTPSLSLTGYTYSQEGVARFLSRLAVIPELEGVSLVSSAQAKVMDHEVFRFQIQAGIQRRGVS